MLEENRRVIRKAAEDCLKGNSENSFLLPNFSVGYVNYSWNLARRFMLKNFGCVGGIIYAFYLGGLCGESVRVCERDCFAIVFQYYVSRLAMDGFSSEEIQELLLLNCFQILGSYSPEVLHAQDKFINLFTSTIYHPTPCSEECVKKAKKEFVSFLKEIGFDKGDRVFDRMFRLKKVRDGFIPRINPRIDTIPSWTEVLPKSKLVEPIICYEDFLFWEEANFDFLLTNNVIDYTSHSRFFEKGYECLNEGGILEVTITFSKFKKPSYFSFLNLRKEKIGMRLSIFPLVVNLDTYFLRKL